MDAFVDVGAKRRHEHVLPACLWVFRLLILLRCSPWFFRFVRGCVKYPRQMWQLNFLSLFFSTGFQCLNASTSPSSTVISCVHAAYLCPSLFYYGKLVWREVVEDRGETQNGELTNFPICMKAYTVMGYCYIGCSIIQGYMWIHSLLILNTYISNLFTSGACTRTSVSIHYEWALLWLLPIPSYMVTVHRGSTCRVSHRMPAFTSMFCSMSVLRRVRRHPFVWPQMIAQFLLLVGTSKCFLSCMWTLLNLLSLPCYCCAVYLVVTRIIVILVDPMADLGVISLPVTNVLWNISIVLNIAVALRLILRWRVVILPPHTK